MSLHQHEFSTTLANKEHQFSYAVLGSGEQALLFVGPLSVYRPLFAPEFLERFRIYGFVDSVWEGDDIEGFNYELSTIVQLYTAFAKNFIDKDIVWFGVSALSFVAIECALQNPEITLAIINSGFPIWLPGSNAKEFFQKSDMMLENDKTRSAKIAANSNAYQRYCQLNNLDPRQAPLHSREATVLEFMQNAERLFHNADTLRENNNAILSPLAAAWRNMNLQAKHLAFAIMFQFNIERLRDLSIHNVPCLSLTGASDLRTPPLIFTEFMKKAPRELTQYITFKELPNAGHFAHYEAPAEFAEAIASYLSELHQPQNQLSYGLT